MFSLKKTRCFASILLIVIVLFHILICVDAGMKFKSFGVRRRIVRPIVRPLPRPPRIRPPIIRPKVVQPSFNRPPIIRPKVVQPSFNRPPIIRPKVVQPSFNRPPVLKPSPLKGTMVHQPFSRPINRPPVISLPKKPVQTPILNGGKSSSSNFIHAEGGGKIKPITAVNMNHPPQVFPPKPVSIKPATPLKPAESAMVLYKRPSTLQVTSSQHSLIKPGISSAGISPSHNTVHHNAVLKPTVPLKTPLSISTPYKPPQSSSVKLTQGQALKLNRPTQPLITSKPTAPEQKISKITTTNVQSHSKPLSVASGSNYPAWANPHLKPQASGSGSHHTPPSSSLPTKPLTSSLSLKPYKPAQNKPSTGSIIKPQTSGSVSSSSHATSALKPQINSKPHTLHHESSHSTSGSSSLIKPSQTNEVKPGNVGSSTSHGHPNHKPLPQTPNQGTISTSSQNHASPIHEPAISSSSSVMSSSNPHPHHEIATAPITSTAQIQSSYPGANHGINSANHAPQHPHTPVQIVNMISNGGPTHNGGPTMGQYGGSGMGQYGGSGTGQMIKEAMVHTLVNAGVHKFLNPSEPSNFNYGTVPINPDQYGQPQVPAAAPSAPAEGSTIVHNNYYVDPNAANVATQGQVQGQATNGQTWQSGFPSGNDGSIQNPSSTGSQPDNTYTGNVAATNAQQNGNLPPSDEGNGNLPPSDEGNGNLPPSDEGNAILPPSDEDNGILPPSDEGNGSLPSSDEENGNLPPSDEGNGNLPPLDEGNGNLPPSDEDNGILPPSDEANENLPPSDTEDGNLSPTDEGNGNLPPSDEGNGNLPPSDEANENLPPSDTENDNLPPSEEGNGNLLPSEKGNGNLPSSDEGNRNEQTFVEEVPVDNNELWELTETIFGYEANISQYINLDLQASEFDSVPAIEATKPLINAREEAMLSPPIKAFTDLFDNYEDNPEKTENADAEKEEALLDEFLKTDAIVTVMQFLEDRNYIAANQWKETLQQLWMRRYNNTMSGFERIFLAEKNANSQIFGGQNWIYFDHQEQSKRIKYTNYQNSLNLADVAQLLKVNYQFDGVDQMGKAMLVGTSPHLEMALYTVCHYIKKNDDWCTVSLAGQKFGIRTHAWLYEGTEMMDMGTIAF